MRCTRTTNCGTLVYLHLCPYCRTLARLVKLVDLRGSVRLRKMTSKEKVFFGGPVFIPDEITSPTPDPDIDRHIVGLRRVGKRVLQELLMPNRWKAKNFTHAKTIVANRQAHLEKCWHFPECDGKATRAFKAVATPTQA